MKLKTLKLWNQETKKPRNHEIHKPRNQDTSELWNMSHLREFPDPSTYRLPPPAPSPFYLEIILHESAIETNWNNIFKKKQDGATLLRICVRAVVCCWRSAHARGGCQEGLGIDNKASQPLKYIYAKMDTESNSSGNEVLKKNVTSKGAFRLHKRVGVHVNPHNGAPKAS